MTWQGMRPKASENLLSGLSSRGDRSIRPATIGQPRQIPWACGCPGRSMRQVPPEEGRRKLLELLLRPQLVEGREAARSPHYQPEDGVYKDPCHGPGGKGREGRWAHGKEQEESGADDVAGTPEGAKPGVRYSLHTSAIENRCYSPGNGGHEGEEVSQKL